MIRIAIAAILAGILSVAALYAFGLMDGGTTQIREDVESDVSGDIADSDDGQITGDIAEHTVAEEAAQAAEELPVSASVYAASFDAHGYYMPTSRIQTGDWVLDHLFIGHEMEFADFRAAGEPADGVPVWMVFNHVDSPVEVNELGQEYAVNNRRVRASRYRIADGSFEFDASHDEVGAVYLYGMIDPDQIRGPVEGTTGTPALTGGMELNGERLRNVSFNHWYGD